MKLQLEKGDKTNEMEGERRKGVVEGEKRLKVDSMLIGKTKIGGERS